LSEIKLDLVISTALRPAPKKGGLDLVSRPPAVHETDLFLLLALAVGLGRVLVSNLGFIGGLSRLLLGIRMIVAAVLLRRSPMRFGSLLVMFGSLLVQVLRHSVSLLVGGSATTSHALDGSGVQSNQVARK
jgi:phosphoglycerol transferase MdoB-like AlkP superfamily enzyme